MALQSNWRPLAVSVLLVLGVACKGSGDEGDGSASSGGATESGASGGATESGTSDGATSAATSMGDTTMGVDPCDCMAGGYYPVCGVDDMTYDAICGLECVPVEILCQGECPCPEVACGDMLTCGPLEPVCTATIPGEPGSPTTYECSAIPAACDGLASPDCTCAGQPGCDCVESPEDYFQVSCALP